MIFTIHLFFLINFGNCPCGNVERRLEPHLQLLFALFPLPDFAEWIPIIPRTDSPLPPRENSLRLYVMFVTAVQGPSKHFHAPFALIFMISWHCVILSWCGGRMKKSEEECWEMRY